MTTTIRVFMTMAGLAVLTATAPVMAQSKGKTGSDGRRAFYLTRTPFDGGQATAACAAGFHMATLTEILDPTSLRYDRTIGEGDSFLADTTAAAPHGIPGWIRTGSPAVNSFSAGRAQCSNGAPGTGWETNNGARRGTAVWLEVEWAPSATFNPISPYVATIYECDAFLRVWCVQD